MNGASNENLPKFFSEEQLITANTGGTSNRNLLYQPMVARSTTEEHRASTPLELLFDLCFVVAVSQAGVQLHHFLMEGNVGLGVLGYGMVFFGIWWAWMLFTWFASAYDTDDVPYRIATLIQIAGALIISAGIPRAFNNADFTVVTAGYVVMRVALVGQWIRAARQHRDRRKSALIYAIGITLCQMGWLARLALPLVPWGYIGFAILVILELMVPILAELAGSLQWHPGHISERYGLFTLIVLGESVLAATTAVQSGLDSGQPIGNLLVVAAGGLLIFFSMWWIYFDQPNHHFMIAAREMRTSRLAFYWGYGHYIIFASAAAVGSGLEVAIDISIHSTSGHVGLAVWGGSATVAIPVACYLISVWLLHRNIHFNQISRNIAYPVVAILILASPALGLVPSAAHFSVLIIGLLMSLLVIIVVATRPIETSCQA
ncbi:uncharacterized protein VTP21DRAFT_5309 [Calcarisporiella thermophila]|uniref:uncharacterized protein n=1 Tax=Calcarisporiella thermophila TaxID=911321 RepID=UPI003741F90A